MIFILYALLGSIIGLIGGIFALGGGLLMVPVLTALFTAQHMDPSLAPRIAVATSQATIVFVACSSLIARIRSGVMEKNIFFMILFPVGVGALVGYYIVSFANPIILRACFCIALACSIISIIYNRKNTEDTSVACSFASFRIPIACIIALAVASGIGSGGLLNGYFSFKKIDIKRAIAIAVSAMLPSSLIATTLFLTTSPAHAVADCVGFVYYPAVLGMALPAIVFAQVGTKINKALPHTYIRNMLIILLMTVECYSLYKIIALL